MTIAGPILAALGAIPELEAETSINVVNEDVTTEKTTNETHLDKKQSVTHFWKITKTRTSEGTFSTTTEKNEDTEEADKTKKLESSRWCCSFFGRAKTK